MITAKFVAIGLGLALTAFCVSTIVLAVQKSKLTQDLNEARHLLDMLEDALKSTTTTITSTTSTTELPTSTTENPEEDIKYRLSESLVPIHYELYLHPKIETKDFSGRVKIQIQTNESTDQIYLHANKLTINKVYLFDAGSAEVEEYELDTLREFLVINLSEKIPEETTFELGIDFEGNMADKIVGLYSSSYLKPDQTEKWIATSKFEPTYARLAYPCFDEPAMKATFETTLVYPKEGNYHALSNMDINTEVDQGDYVEVTFNKSVPMSTYLSCFIVSDFDYKEATIETNGIGNPFQIRVFATPAQIEKTQFALDVGKSVIEYYIDYFQIEYPLPKLDMAAIPDFVSGAMEHWGLVTYRETSLLYDETISSTYNKQRVASVIAHEFAHMWFGNLVTMMWWNDLWLNEGFASFIENQGVDSVFPEWRMQDQFITGTLHSVLKLDGTLGSHPIVQTVDNPDEITEIFDTITYSKGSSIMRMLKDFLGEENFRTAVTNYLNEYKYSNAVTDDFLTEIDKLDLGIDVKMIMRTWTEQMGLPVVEVAQITDTQYKLTQRRFFANPDDYDGIYDDSPFDYTWSIPITYKTSENIIEVQRAWFYYDETELWINLPSAVDWVKFNYDQMGYYRVNYELDMWRNLSAQLMTDPGVFSVADRACLLNDAFSLADATQLEYDTALDMTTYLAEESDYVPWNVAASKITSINRALLYTEFFANFSKYARELIQPIYEKVTWEVGNNHLENRLRVTILDAACSLGLPQCLNEVATRFGNWLADDSVRPHPDIREVIYYYGMMQAGNGETWEKVWQLYLDEEDASEKSKLMYGLSGAQQPWILNRFLSLAWDEKNVRGQDYFTCLQNIAANAVGEPIVWEYVREYWPDLVDRFGLNERYLGSMIPSITSRFSTQTKLEEMEHFFAKYPEAGAGQAARVRALETVKNNIAWLDNNSDKIGQWLEILQEAEP